MMEADHFWVLTISLCKEASAPPGEAVCLLWHHLVSHTLSEAPSFMVKEGHTVHSSLNGGDGCKERGII